MSGGGGDRGEREGRGGKSGGEEEGDWLVEEVRKEGGNKVKMGGRGGGR